MWSAALVESARSGCDAPSVDSIDCRRDWLLNSPPLALPVLVHRGLSVKGSRFASLVILQLSTVF